MTNRAVRALLRSPFKRLLHGVCELKYSGRRTGRAVALPVLSARAGDRVVVYVGRAGAKTWWRNFAEPWPVSVKLTGGDRRGTGRIVVPADPDREQVATIYRRVHPKVDTADEPLVVIDLAPAP